MRPPLPRADVMMPELFATTVAMMTAPVAVVAAEVVAVAAAIEKVTVTATAKATRRQPPVTHAARALTATMFHVKHLAMSAPTIEARAAVHGTKTATAVAVTTVVEETVVETVAVPPAQPVKSVDPTRLLMRMSLC